ncbi:MAG: ABC transporter ATP-binding protein [Deltaproteobacteria bacterium]|jgi:ABC-type lipoprotein export system ATPase subunit|nr:ABC transporter ATP-binding protein [Deltaproteobacteria bacterium]
MENNAMLKPSVQAPLITARGLTRVYELGASQVIGVDSIDLDIPEGEMVALKGNSGSGKSTLLALLAGLDRPTSGRLVVADHDLLEATEDDLTRYRREVIGMVFQSFNLLPTLSVLENVALPGLLAGHRKESVDRKAMDLLSWLNLSSRRNHRPAELSGGEMQRTAIARALINEPLIIIADEPTGNLDSTNGQIVIDLLAQLNREFGRTVIIATHSTLADSYATMELRIKDGALAESKCHP